MDFICWGVVAVIVVVYMCDFLFVCVHNMVIVFWKTGYSNQKYISLLQSFKSSSEWAISIVVLIPLLFTLTG